MMSVPAVGIAWWLAYNYALYCSPLEFMTGQYSAFAQQQAISEYGSLTTKGNPGLSLYVYTWSVWEVVGAAATVLGTLGLAWLIWRQGMSTATLVVGVAFATFVFEVLSLSLGQSVMNNDHSLPTGLFNVRYGIAPLLFFALGGASRPRDCAKSWHEYISDSLTQRRRWSRRHWSHSWHGGWSHQLIATP